MDRHTFWRLYSIGVVYGHSKKTDTVVPLKLKPSSKWPLFIAGVGGIALTSAIILLLFAVRMVGVAMSSAQVLFLAFDQQSSSTHTPVESVALPVRLKIPKIDVDAPVEYVGLTPDGAMDVPKERAHVGWFHLGSHPGENGSAVMAGHYGWKNKEGSVFDNLYKLRKGDTVYVEDDSGVTTAFVVRESRRYDPEADTSGVFGSHDGKSHLNLITCEGTWDESAEQYPQRLVVFADKEQ